jgi:hypothetical protein
MIKFFRKIRLRLFSENKFGKYLIYAIGEIILVVIGILIALQINNWKENRKVTQLTRSIYATVKSDLNADLARVNTFLMNYDSIRKPLFIAFIKNELTKEKVLENPNLLNGFRGWEDIRINTRGYQLLTNLPNTAIANETLATQISKFYNIHLHELETAQMELSQEFTDNNFHFKRKGFIWKYVLGEDDEHFTTYYLNDDDAKNRMAAYYLFFRIYAEELRDFQKQAQVLIDSINAHLNDKVL